MRAWSSGSHDRDLPMNIRVSPRNGDQKRVGGFERVVETGKPSVFEVDTSLWWPGKTLNLGICPDREARLWGEPGTQPRFHDWLLSAHPRRCRMPR